MTLINSNHISSARTLSNFHLQTRKILNFRYQKANWAKRSLYSIQIIRYFKIPIRQCQACPVKSHIWSKWRHRWKRASRIMNYKRTRSSIIWINSQMLMITRALIENGFCKGESYLRCPTETGTSTHARLNLPRGTVKIWSTNNALESTTRMELRDRTRPMDLMWIITTLSLDTHAMKVPYLHFGDS